MQLDFQKIRCGRIHFKRLAKTLDKILYKTLHRAMGRISFIRQAFSFLVMRTTLVSLRLARKELFRSQSLQQIKISLPKIDQKC